VPTTRNKARRLRNVLWEGIGQEGSGTLIRNRYAVEEMTGPVKRGNQS
jgi:hypothetical protein